MYGMFYKKQIIFVFYLTENRNKNQLVSCFTEEIYLLLICVHLAQSGPVLVQLGSVFIFTGLGQERRV